MDRYVVAVVLGAAAVAVAAVLSRRSTGRAAAPAPYDAPAQVDRGDFLRPEAPAAVVVFASATCLSCADAVARARRHESPAVAVTVAEAKEHRALHRKYGIEAVPIVVVADGTGAVRSSFVGVPPEDELAAAVAAAVDVTDDHRTASDPPS